MSNAPQAVEILDADVIKSVIQPDKLSYLSGLDIFDSINSTNSYLLTSAKSGTASGWVCFAEQQTKGRGRHGRTWLSPRGASLACSLLWRFPATQPDLSALSLAVAVIVAKVLQQYGIQAGIELKWPNDVYFQGRKLSGILLESLPEANGQIAVVIGIGLNLFMPHDQLKAVNAIDVAEITGQVVRRNYLAGLLINELLGQLPIYQRMGLSVFIEAWRELDVLQGKEVIVHTEKDKIIGVMQGINLQGELLLKNALGDQRFKCGEVSVRLGL